MLIYRGIEVLFTGYETETFKAVMQLVNHTATLVQVVDNKWIVFPITHVFHYGIYSSPVRS